MLAFATEFPLADGQTPETFLIAVQDWILGSPHTRLTAHDLKDMGTTGQWSVSKGNETVRSLRGRTESNESASVRYKRVDDGIEWTTTVTFAGSPQEAWVAVRIFCESDHPTARLPSVKKPVLVETLLNALGGGQDGDLTVGTAPHLLGNGDIEVAVRVIRGDANCRLPVIYVSSAFHGDPIVEVNRLADKVAGVAHVVVEPNRHFSLRLKLEANSENVYGGTIGVYWPDGGGRRLFYLGKDYETPAELERALVDEVRVALTNRRPLDRCTWASTQEMLSRQTIEALKASGSGDVNQYVETFEAELASKDEKLADAQRDISRLQAEVRVLAARSSSGAGATISTGVEQDLYPNEIFDIVLDALDDYRSRVPNDSRRKHVVDAVLAANSRAGIAGKQRDCLKELLRGFTNLDHRCRRGLEDMGFSIFEDGKHHKIVYRGDDRYTFPLPKSGSDHRGGLNAASDIGKLLF